MERRGTFNVVREKRQKKKPLGGGEPKCGLSHPDRDTSTLQTFVNDLRPVSRNVSERRVNKNKKRKRFGVKTHLKRARKQKSTNVVN